ncbi:O-methyltransferase [Paenibacillus aurantiacus]|uniref:O-methyltransferase n=1 Tax=Paenibacillus aurantiacus TaxID=1936118 RepID=A0ABV5KT47_9BACL
MGMESTPLARQMDYAFRQMESELIHSAAGTVTIQIRNDVIGKYGICHNPIESRNGVIEEESSESGLKADQVLAFRKLALDALQYKRGWTHGEIRFDFSVRKGSWSAGITFESNYNMANIANGMFRLQPKYGAPHALRDAP